MASCGISLGNTSAQTDGVILPLFSGETEWPEGVRAVLYFSGMIYFFLGVAIIADAFVASIEVVTSRRRKVMRSGRQVTVRVWNDTVATLSLMALGSSAPEIALSVVDLFKNNFFFAPLGAQTIVGSAAFNLLVIVAVCIAVVPSSETRQIRELPAFYVTAAISLFAYLWLVVILIIISPDVVEVWEAATTFAFLPMLIWISYKVDVRDLGNTRSPPVEASSATLPTIEEEKPVSYLSFDNDSMAVQGTEQGERIEVMVKRTGTLGLCSCLYRTEPYSAVPGFDFEEVAGSLEFVDGQKEATLSLEILPKRSYAVSRQLLLLLEEITGEAEFSPETDGGADAAILTITIASRSSSRSVLRSVDSIVNLNGIRRGFADWLEQIVGCVYCNGGPEEQKEATKWDWTSHLVSLPWKLLFSLVPPTSFFGGWACFYASLGFIGLLTAWISDLAELFGDVLGICDDVTALVFVALGTSMPDLFASLTAAKEEPTADASIVNVTGSNSVNVFLGLGVPWTIGAIYWAAVGPTDAWSALYAGTHVAQGRSGAVFVVEAQNLGFCVLVFSVACLIALTLIHLRRKYVGAELGGAWMPKVATSTTFVILWVAFTGVSSWKVMRWHEASSTEVLCVLLLVAASSCAAAAGTTVVIVRHSEQAKAAGEQSPVPVPARRSSAVTSFSGADHRKKRADRASMSSADRASNSGSEASSSQGGRVYLKGFSSDSFASGFSSKNGIQVSI